MARLLPFFQFYPGDWIADPVSGCSLAAQGLWLRLLLLMHDSERYGHLSQAGKPIPVDRVCRLIGCSLAEYETCLGELMDAGVPSLTPRGVLFSRRMVKDEERRAEDRGRKAKSRSKHKESNGNGHNDVTSESRDGHGEVTGRSQKSEVRSQKSEFTSGGSTDSVAVVASGVAPPLEKTPAKRPQKPPHPGSPIDLQGVGAIVQSMPDLPLPSGAVPASPLSPVQVVREMLIDWLYPCRFQKPPDERLCEQLLRISGSTDHLASWLRGMGAKKDRRSIESWGWFLTVAKAELQPAMEGSHAAD